ncbi:uncharacterized protein A1O9_05877 [Exophiala aquamarina CBS 119918]|uniref:Polyprenal reductase n=1 Tax=Exophiala aquamarina CBS 119918 TaxID=1182545 RepID=A0A072PR02_9EURO|nr:uncharacterized protein A1O9_05877 [Exophiala aquamarina CBS 119918]KEF57955.1 hypothetical protein A1O9_05877 [Exophiala aquamarina CBS 119918]
MAPSARLILDSSLRNLDFLLAQKPILDLVSWTIKAFYLLSSISILIVRLTPVLRERFLDYGVRAPTGTAVQYPTPGDNTKKPSASLPFLDFLATLTVPHSWFTHFYVLCVICSVFLFQQDVWCRMTFPARVSSQALLLQGGRRLLECLCYHRKSNSRMWVGHYLVGLAFYFFTNFAILLDGVDWSHWDPTHPNNGKNVNSEGLLQRLLFGSFFALASYSQSLSHYYLFKLKKYTLPDNHGFKYFIAPHYTAECVLYASLAVIAAPPGNYVHWNLFCALVFVAVNLGVTADGTKQWMLTKFPDRRREIRLRRKLIPFLW